MKFVIYSQILSQKKIYLTKLFTTYVNKKELTVDLRMINYLNFYLFVERFPLIMRNVHLDGD